MGIRKANHIQVVLTEDKKLEDVLSDIDISTIKHLTIKGELNCESIKYLHNKMSATLVELDITGANIINDDSYNCGFLRVDKGEKWIHIMGLKYFKKLEIITLGPSITNYEVTYADMPLQEFPCTDTLFDAPSLRHIEIHKDNPILYSVDGVVYTKNGTLIRCPICKEGHYDIPDTTVKVGNNAFDSCKKLKTINIPYSVEYIEISSILYNSFSGCTASIKIDSKNPKYKINDNGKIARNIDETTQLKIIESYVKELVREILKDFDIELKSETLYDAIFLMRPKGSNLDVMGILMSCLVDEFSVAFSDEEIVEINTMNDIVKWLVDNLNEDDLWRLLNEFEE